jgi:hypothetical protein
MLRNIVFRITLTLSMWIAIVYMVMYLPPWFGENGGVPALLTIQTPAVISALVGAFYCRRILSSSKTTTLKAFNYLSVSGALLCMAMAVSLIEVVYGKDFQSKFFGIVPVFHIIIHILEQIGIYLYGVGVATIEHTIVRPPATTSAGRLRGRIEYVFGGLIPYFALTVDLSSDKDDENVGSKKTTTMTVVRRSARLSGGSRVME